VDSERGLPALVDTGESCRLFVANDLAHASNVLGADLGIPVVAGDTFYLLFGDTIGFAGIWPQDESHPDAVGFANAADVTRDPSALCGGLGIVSLPAGNSIGPTVDPSVRADFAGGAMNAPDLSVYIHNPAGHAGSTFPNLPGDFEVPSGAFAHDGALYASYTTVVSPQDPTMTSGYLARWDAPSPDAIPSYDILYGYGDPDFINVATAVQGDTLYLFGTGTFRASPVHLGRKSLAGIESPGFERTSTPVIATAGYGEVSVRYFAAIDRWMFLAEEQADGNNRIVARFADAPDGPWSDAITVADMADPTFTGHYCCAPSGCTGDQFLNCDQTGFYGAYLLPDVAVGNGTFTVAFTLSSFSPYGASLFHATFTSG
jgi:hypothetical protein